MVTRSGGFCGGEERAEVIDPRFRPLGQESSDLSAAEVDRLFTQLPLHPQSDRNIEPWERELRALVAHAFYYLDDRSKIVLVLYYFERLTFDEVADVVGLPSEAVEDVLRAALHAVRNHLRPSARRGLRLYLEDAIDAVPLNTPALAFAAILAA